MGENDFEREVLDRLVKLESKMDMVLMQCPQCQTMVHKHDVAIASLSQSVDGAHQRIDGIYRTASIISAAIALVIQVAVFIWQGVQH